MKKTFIMSAKGDVDLSGVPTDIEGYSVSVGTSATLNFNNDGTWSTDTTPEGGFGDNMSGSYISGGTIGSAFEISYTATDLTGGVGNPLVTGMTQGIWYPINTTRTFFLTDNNDDMNASNWQINITIRKITNTANIGSTTVIMVAEGACVSSDTYVLLSNGSFKQAKDLTLEDTLTSFYVPGMIDTDTKGWRNWTTTDISNSNEITSGILNLNTFTQNKFIRINNTFETTISHTNFIKRDGVYQWIRSDEINVGDFIIKQDKSEIEVISVDLINEEKSFTHINVEDIDTFFVKMGEDVIVTHNAS